MENKKILTSREIISALKKHHDVLEQYKVKKIGLFGSYARGEQTSNSDIDFLIDFKEPTFDNFMNLVFFLENIFNTHVELITDGNLSPYMLPYIEKEIKWYEA